MIFIKFTKEKIVVGVIVFFLCCFPYVHYQYIAGYTMQKQTVENENSNTKRNYAEMPIIEEEVKPTLYDTYSPKDIELLFGVVEAETRGCDFDAKCNVVSVIFNRMKDPRFSYATNIENTVLAQNQFAVVPSGAYKTVEVTQETINACEYVFEHGDTVAGAVFFENMKSNIHGSYATFVLNDGKHKFYK